MFKLIVVALMLFGLYVLLGQVYPAAFTTSYLVPLTKVSLTYATTIMVLGLVLGMSYVTIK